MEIRLIRSATIRLSIAGRDILIDPYLAAKGAGLSYAGGGPSPVVELPCSSQQVIAGTDLVIISHLHSDHFDTVARELLSKEAAIFCQPGEESQLEEMGFTDVTPVRDRIDWQGISITRTAGQHGCGPVLQDMGEVSGFLFQADDKVTVYWAGDTIWCDAVAEVIEQVKPDIIITHSAGAMWNNTLILMDAAQTVQVCRAAPGSVVIATHMDSVDHATVSRQALREYADTQGISPEQLLIPVDGETLCF